MPNYLDSSKAARDYTALAMKFGGNVGKFNVAWKQALTDNAPDVVEQAVNENDVLPTKIITDIQTAIDKDPVFSKFKITFGVEAGSIWIEPENEVGAKGHKKLANKTEQQTTLEQRVLIPEAIYKLQRLDHMTYLKGGALVRWVMQELPLYVIHRIAQAILVGGVTNEDNSAFTAIKPIVGDTLALTRTLPKVREGNTLAKAIIEDVAKVRGTNRVIFIASNAYSELVEAGDAFAVAFLTGAISLGAEGGIVPTDLLDAATNPYVIVDVDSYLLGFSGQGVETLTDFQIMQNAQAIESRAYVMGSLTRGKAALVAKVSDTPAG